MLNQRGRIVIHPKSRGRGAIFIGSTRKSSLASNEYNDPGEVEAMAYAFWGYDDLT